MKFSALAIRHRRTNFATQSRARISTLAIVSAQHGIVAAASGETPVVLKRGIGSETTLEIR